MKKPQVFKTPDGKEFTNRKEWREYMMLTFYSFKNKVDEPEPLVKGPGSIDGQNFDISDCKNSTMVIMDHTEQIQVDDITNCRLFVGACTSSIFIRNCSNCVFFTCCRQLRLRDVSNCTFFIYSMGEVHIEYTKDVKFAPFRGGYPEHGAHMKAANLNPEHNMWYEVYDHNDPHKTQGHWSLLPESEYEEPWFPTGVPCENVIAQTKKGSIVLPTSDSNMQSFSLEQLKQGVSTSLEAAAEQRKVAPGTPSARLPMSPQRPETERGAAPPLPAPTSAEAAIAAAIPPSAPQPAAAGGGVPTSANTPEGQLHEVLKLFAGFKAGEDILAIVAASFSMILPTGKMLSVTDFMAAAPVTANELWTVERSEICSDGSTALAVFWATDGENDNGTVCHYTAVLKRDPLNGYGWRLIHAQKSLPLPFNEAPPPFYS